MHQQVCWFCFGGVSHPHVDSGDDSPSDGGGEEKYPGVVAIHLNVSLLRAQGCICVT